MGSDEELLAQIRAGDMRAFDLLYARYEGRLFAFLVSVTGSREDAEDIFHEAILKTLKSADVPFQPGGFRLWLFRVAHNLARNRARSRVRGLKASLVEQRSEPEPLPSADAQLEAREREAALGLAVQGLPPRLSEVYQLRISGLSYAEMAEVLDVPLGTLKSRMHQMVEYLRQEMKSWIVRS